MFFILPHRDVVRNNQLKSVQWVIFSVQLGDRSHLIKSVEEYLKTVTHARYWGSVSSLICIHVSAREQKST